MVVPGTRTRAWPTSSREKLRGPRTNVRTTSVPPGPIPLRVICSTLVSLVVLTCSVPFANRNRPKGSSPAKLVSRLATPQNAGTTESPLLLPRSRTKRPAVEPTVPSLMIFSWALKVRVNSLRAASISSVTEPNRSSSGSSSRPAAARMIPPDSSMKNEVPWVMVRNELLAASTPLSSMSVQLPARKATLTVPAVSGAPVIAYRKVAPWRCATATVVRPSEPAPVRANSSPLSMTVKTFTVVPRTGV